MHACWDVEMGPRRLGSPSALPGTYYNIYVFPNHAAFSCYHLALSCVISPRSARRVEQEAYDETNDEVTDVEIDDDTIEEEVEEVPVAVEAEEVDEEMQEFEVERRPAADALGGKHDVLGHHRLVQRQGHVHQHIPQPDQLGEYQRDQRHVADDVHGGSVDYSSSARAACCACPRPSSSSRACRPPRVSSRRFCTTSARYSSTAS